MLEAQLSPVYEKCNIDAETDGNGLMNPMFSGEDTVFPDIADQDKMDITW